jgi:hypothetical protein
MKNFTKHLYLFLTILLIRSTFNLSAQGTYDTDSEYDESADYDDHDKAIFDNDPIFENYSFFEDRSNNDDLQALDGTFQGNGPIDGGISWVVGGLVGYGLSRIRKSKKIKRKTLD